MNLDCDSASDAYVRFSNVSRAFEDVQALRDVSFDVLRGSVCGLIGPNGAGKSTIIRLIVGALSPTSGSVVVGGASAPFSAPTRLQISWVAESPALYTRLTVRQNLVLAAAFYHVENRDARIESVLAQVGMDDAENRRVSALSNGQQRRISIARALMNTPKLLVLDEPSAGLDVESASAIYEVVSEISAKSDTTVIVTTHRLEEVARICDDVIVVNSGSVVFHGPPSKLVQAGKFRIVSVTATGLTPEMLIAIRAIEGINDVAVTAEGLNVSVDISFDSATLNQLLVQFGVRVTCIGEDQHAIERAFMELTGSVTR